MEVKQDTNGILSLPNYLIIVIIVMMLLFSMVIYAISSFHQQTQMQELSQTIDHILSSAEYLTYSKSYESKISQIINIPSCVRFISFGPPPTHLYHLLGINNSSVLPNNMYWILYDNGEIETQYSPVFFSSSFDAQSSVLYEGKYMISIQIKHEEAHPHVHIFKEE